MKCIAIFIFKRKNFVEIRRDNFRVVDEGSDPRVDKIFIKRHAQNYIAENFQHVAEKFFNALVNFQNVIEVNLSRFRLAENRLARRVEMLQLSIGRNQNRFK